MPRSIWKIPFITLHKCKDTRAKIFQRACTITPDWIGKTVSVHSGLGFVNITITENHVGFKFGQFARTKKRVIHKKKKKK